MLLAPMPSHIMPLQEHSRRNPVAFRFRFNCLYLVMRSLTVVRFPKNAGFPEFPGISFFAMWHPLESPTKAV